MRLWYVLLMLANARVDAAKILAVIPSIWRSHYLFGNAIITELTARGHNVTLISAFGMDTESDEIDTKWEVHKQNWLEMGLSFSYDEIRDKSILEAFTRLIYASTSNVDLLLGSEEVQRVLQTEKHFDLLLLETSMSDALLGLSTFYNAPVVSICPTGINKWLNEVVGNPHRSALDPNSFLPLLETMNISERIANTLMSIFEKLTYNFLYLPYQEAIYQRHFTKLNKNGDQQLPALIDLVHNVSLVLVNSNPLIQYPRPFLPNVIEIGGAHLYKQPFIMNEDVRKYFDTATDGIIYVSFGATFRTIDLPRDKLNALLEAIKPWMGKKRVVIKWENQEENNLPPDVLKGNWLPQFEILAHPNVKLFISNAGLMSVMEAIDTSTPILGIPILPEQELNMKRIERMGCGLSLSYENITTANLLAAIEELTTNTSYLENMQRASKIFNDRFESPMEKAIYHIEYIIRHNGARHLQSHATRLGFFETELIDVSLIILTGISIIIAVPSIIICVILRKTHKKNEKNDRNSKSTKDKNE